MTTIEWTHPPGFLGETINFTNGCSPVSPGCKNCYAEAMAARLATMPGKVGDRYRLVVKRDGDGNPRGRWSGDFREVPEALAVPLKTRRPTCHFVNSMSDLFGEGVSDEWIAAVHGVMAATPWHRYIVLTKRPERMSAWHRWVVAQDPRAVMHEAVKRAMGYHHLLRPPVNGIRWPLPNVIVGTSIEDQRRAVERIDPLLRVPAVCRMISAEPLLESVDFGLHPMKRGAGQRPIKTTGIDWVIVGGESGVGARPCDLGWIRGIVAQCRAAGVPVFVKQLGANPRPDTSYRFPLDASALLAMRSRKGGDPAEWPEDLRVREWPAALAPAGQP